MVDGLVEFLNVFHIDPRSQYETLIGKLEYAPDGRLTVIEVAHSFDTRLRDAVAAMNAKDAIVEIVPSDAPSVERRALASKTIRREDNAFFGAMNAFLQRYYAFTIG